MKPFSIFSIRGGMNDHDPSSSLISDQCTFAQNVEFVRSTLGERRRGSLAIDLPSELTAKDMVTFLYRHLPTINEADAELWALGVTAGISASLQRKDTAWHTVTMTDVIATTGSYPFNMVGQTLHGKLFLAYKSAKDRLHVWDGTSLRLSGLAQPSAAPTAVNGGGVGTLSSTRYYRTRYIVKSGVVILRRSEPSDVLTFSPSGTNASVVVTKPVTISEDETHWELEASLDNVNFYIFATTLVGTTTVTDSTSAVIGYTDLVLSDDIGDNTVIPSGKFLTVDRDRLIIGGSWEDSNLSSRVSWTPVFGDIAGKGNDERIPIDTDNFVDLDTFEGGELTAQSGPIDGSIYIFKWTHIYKLTSTGQRERAYESKCVTKQRGAIPGSLVEGLDGAGRPCLYFLDPKVGPCRIGPAGLSVCGQDIRETWRQVNTAATDVAARGVFYPESQQVRWSVAVDGSNTPNFGLTLQINETQDVLDGVRRGWSIFTGPSTEALAMCLFSTNIDDGVARTIVLKPFIGKADTLNAHIQMLDSGDDDNGTEYVAHIITRPYILAGLTNKFGIRAGALLAKANVDTTVRVILTADFGLEQSESRDVRLDPHDDEETVIKQIDNLYLTSLYSLQIEFTDIDVPNGRWELYQIDLTPTPDQGN